MNKLAIILTREPYGAINAAEAVRHALGALGDETGVSLLLTDGGVLLASKGQEVGTTGFTSLGEALKDCVDMGVTVFADAESLKKARLDAGNIIEGVGTVGSDKISAIIAEADHTVIY